MSINIGNNLAKLRKEKGYTQEKLAKLAQVNNVMISRYENGDKEMSVETLSKLAKALETSLDSIVFGNGEKVVHYKKEEQSEGEKIARAIVVLVDNGLIESDGHGYFYLLDKYNLWNYTNNMIAILGGDDANTKGYKEFLETKIMNYARNIDVKKLEEEFDDLPDY